MVNRLNMDERAKKLDSMMYPNDYSAKGPSYRDRDVDSIYRCGNDRNDMDKGASFDLWHQHGLSKTNANMEQNVGMNTWYTTGLIVPNSAYVDHLANRQVRDDE